MNKLIKKLTRRIKKSDDCNDAEVFARTLQAVCVAQSIRLDVKRKQKELILGF